VNKCLQLFGRAKVGNFLFQTNFFAAVSSSQHAGALSNRCEHPRLAQSNGTINFFLTAKLIGEALQFAQKNVFLGA
jgi:hypothetical protein